MRGFFSFKFFKCRKRDYRNENKWCQDVIINKTIPTEGDQEIAIIEIF